MNRRLWRDLLTYAPGLLVSLVFGTGLTVIFARLSSPEEFGAYLLILALTTTVGTPLGWWLSQAALRLLPGYDRDGRLAELLSALSLLGALFGVLASLLVLGALSIGFGGAYFQPDYVLPAAIITFFTLGTTLQAAVLQATFATRRWTIFTSLTAVGRLVIALALYRLIGVVPALLWGTASTMAALWVIREVQQRRELAHGVLPSSLGELTRIWAEATHFGMPLGIAAIGDQVLTYSDRYIIGAVLGSAAVGLYSTNYSIAEKLLILIQAPLIYAASPQMFSSWEHGEHADAERLIKTATRWLLMLGAPVLAFTLIRSQLLASILLGPTFEEGHMVIPIVAGSILLWALSQYGHASFQLSKDSWVIAGALVCAGVANALAVLLLTRNLGYIGGALGTGVGYIVYAGIIFVVSRIRGSLPWRVPWSTFFRAAGAAFLAVVVWNLSVPHRLTGVLDLCAALLGGLLGLTVYVVVLASFGEIPGAPRARVLAALLSAWLRRRRRRRRRVHSASG